MRNRLRRFKKMLAFHNPVSHHLQAGYIRCRIDTDNYHLAFGSRVIFTSWKLVSNMKVLFTLLIMAKHRSETEKLYINQIYVKL